MTGLNIVMKSITYTRCYDSSLWTSRFLIIADYIFSLASPALFLRKKIVIAGYNLSVFGT